MDAARGDSFSVSGRSVMVVGATGALGQAVARDLCAGAARVTLTGGNADKLEELREELAKTGEVCAVNRRPDGEADAAAMVAAALAAFDGLDGLVVAGGANRVALIEEMTTEQFDEVMEANVRSTWMIARAFGRHAKPRGEGGSVVLVSSTRGALGHPAGYSAYSTSKGAVNLLNRTLAAEWGAAQIRVNAVAPTVFRSDLTAWMYEDNPRATAVREAFLARIPLGRLAEPDDVTGPVRFFLSDAARFITGQVLYVDGGYTAC